MPELITLETLDSDAGKRKLQTVAKIAAYVTAAITVELQNSGINDAIIEKCATDTCLSAISFLISLPESTLQAREMLQDSMLLNMHKNELPN